MWMPTRVVCMKRKSKCWEWFYTWGCRVIRIIPVSHMWSLGLSTAATSSKLKVDGYRKKKEMNDIAHTSSRTPNMVRTSQSCTPSYRWFMKYTWCTNMPALKVSACMSFIMAGYTDACAPLLDKKTESKLFDALYWLTCQDVSSCRFRIQLTQNSPISDNSFCKWYLQVKLLLHLS